MCTVSVIRLAPAPSARASAAGYRLVVNRDEQRDRAEASPPRWRTFSGERRALYPVDPTGGGTWVAASDRGLALCLLNVNLVPAPRLPAPGRLVSRGRIILDALHGEDSRGVLDIIERLDLENFAPFRLLAIDPPRAGTPLSGVEIAWDRDELRARTVAEPAVCLVSSGLGDTLVAPRLGLFDQLVTSAAPTPEAQDRFHRHTWPDRPEISVMMSRLAARTVSVLSLEVLPGAAPGALPRVQMRYEPVADRAAVAVPASQGLIAG